MADRLIGCVVALLLATGVLASAASALAAESSGPAAFPSETSDFLQLPEATSVYPFSARNLSVRMALKLFSKNLRIGLEIAEDVEGEIMQLSPVDETRFEYLESLALEFDFVWYFDGAILRVSPVGATETKVLPLAKHDGRQIIEALQALEIYQHKFIHRFGVRTRTLRVSGPADYVELVEAAVEAIDKADRQKVELVRGDVNRALDTAVDE